MAFRAQTTAGATTSTGATLTLPTGHTTNDILIVDGIKLDAGAITLTGYAHVTGSPVTIGSATYFRLWKRDGGAESNPAISFASTYWDVTFSCYSGRSTDADPFDFTTLVATGSASATTLVAGDPTVTNAGTDIVGYASSGSNAVSDDGILANNRVDFDGSRLADSVNVGAGAFGTITWTFSPAAVDRGTIVSGLKPTGGAAPTVKTLAALGVG